MANGAANITSPPLDAFLDAIDERFLDLPLQNLTPFLVDALDAHLLPFVARGFDLEGFNGMHFAASDPDKQRAILRQAIELHRRKGTPFSIRRALQSVGFVDATLTEGVSALYNGLVNHNGAILYGGSNWAHFNMLASLGEAVGLTADVIAIIHELVEAYKPARSLLVDLEFSLSLNEYPSPEEEVVFDVHYGLLSEELLPSDSTDILLTFAEAAEDVSAIDELVLVKTFRDGSSIILS